MKKPSTHRELESDRRLHECIGLFVAHGQHRCALEMLDKGIEAPLP